MRMIWLAIAWCAGWHLWAAEAPVTRGAAVELPPMMVEESVASAPWHYVQVGGAEFLSRCSALTTRQFVEGWLASMQLVRVLVPEEFLARSDLPTVIILYSQDLQQTVSAEIQRELQGGAARGERVNIAPNMRLSDRDIHAAIVYIDESQFNAAGLSIAPSHVRYLMKGRLPDLPAWLIEGCERLWHRADFLIDPITLYPVAGNAAGPRVLLPASDLFATEAVRAAENPHPRRTEVRAATQELFVRWAISSCSTTREALWNFARRAAESPVTEEMFEGFFGFDFAELRDRLSDYLPQAVDDDEWIGLGKLPPLPRFEVERATPNQIARVRGEWERLAIAHVQRRLPEVREPYIAQARRTLRRAFTAGDRDPRLLATMGLCEIDAGNPEGAREFLEPAVVRGVIRPRAYHELARLRFAELGRAAPESKRFSFGELAPVIEPLRRATTQAPVLPEVFTLLAEVWARSGLSPNTAEFAELEMGARLFTARPAVTLPIAVALACHGKKSEALAVLDGSAAHLADETTRAAITRLRAELADGLAPPLANPAPAAPR